MSETFSTDQQEYLKGFMVGVEARRGAFGLPLSPATDQGAPAADPNDLQRVAQDRTIAEGGKLVAEEDAKRARNPLDRFDEIEARAAEGKFPRGTDVFMTKYQGLFYVAPAQNSYMCRLRIPGGIVAAHQFRGVADIAEELGGGYADMTTRANLQIREIGAASAPEIVQRLSEIGLTSRGAGADNVRNVTGSATAGIDAQELIDTRPHSRAMHHFILHRRELYGLPRKFNIAFDGGGRISALAETNDIEFAAVADHNGKIWYRLGLGGITGHGDFARETGVLVGPADAVRLANSILRVFIREGDRTNRNRARLKYLLDRWGLERFLDAVQAEYGAALIRAEPESLQTRPTPDRAAHIGVHAQRQSGKNWIGVIAPGGRLSAPQMRGLAAVAERHGSATLRLTVWQNALVSDVADADVPAALADIAALGLHTEAGALRTGMVACTGNAGCRFAASATKRHAGELVDWLEARIAPNAPVNIHLTGCHHSCAQHLIADIGLLGARVERGEDTVEGYDLHVGGGCAPDARIGRLVREKVAFDALPPLVLALLAAWMRDRAPGETFLTWSARQETETLVAICADQMAEA